MTYAAGASENQQHDRCQYANESRNVECGSARLAQGLLVSPFHISDLLAMSQPHLLNLAASLPHVPSLLLHAGPLLLESLSETHNLLVCRSQFSLALCFLQLQVRLHLGIVCTPSDYKTCLPWYVSNLILSSDLIVSVICWRSTSSSFQRICTACSRFSHSAARRANFSLSRVCSRSTTSMFLTLSR